VEPPRIGWHHIRRLCRRTIESLADENEIDALHRHHRTRYSHAMTKQSFDVVIVGGGPAGLSAALNLGRARRHVLLSDAGPARNAAAEHIHGFVTRDGTPPAEFRRIAREQLQPYAGVVVRDARVEEVRGERGAFEVRLATGEMVASRRILLCTGMIDELPDIDGFRALWGKSIAICPYCHGWEAQDRRFGFLTPNAESIEFALLLRGWSGDVVVLTNANHTVPPEVRTRVESAGVRIEERRIVRVVGSDGQLEHVEFADGSTLPLEMLFARPPQRQVPLVQSLALELDGGGFVQIDAQRQTSIRGIYAGGDLVSPMQGAVLAAASAVGAAGMLNHELTAELATSGALP
jgi:thioredoxin reductase